MPRYKLYKLTDENYQSGTAPDCTVTQWGPGVTHETNGYGDLCGPGWLHACEHPLLAALLCPLHFSDCDGLVLWECDGDGEIKRDGQLKCGVTRLTTVRQIPLLLVTTEMCVRFAILCAKKVCENKAWNEWADKWLSGEDRSDRAASAAWVAAEVAMTEEMEAAAEAALSALVITHSRSLARAAKAAWSAVRLNSISLDLIAIAEEACQ